MAPRPKKAVNAGIWYHIAVVSGPGGMEFYINGQLVDRDDYSGSLSEAAGGANFIGKSNWPKDKMFEGYISELRNLVEEAIRIRNPFCNG